jgi:hypothetical protein
MELIIVNTEYVVSVPSGHTLWGRHPMTNEFSTECMATLRKLLEPHGKSI